VKPALLVFADSTTSAILRLKHTGMPEQNEGYPVGPGNGNNGNGHSNNGDWKGAQDPVDVLDASLKGLGLHDQVQ
jgi:hypothetical protein